MALRDRRTWWLELGLLLRGVWFLGRRHSCPICGWSVRTFVHGGGSFRPREGGYCPRCNSKGRHRLIWKTLREDQALLPNATRLLHVSPHFSVGRLLSADGDRKYVGLDLQPGPHVSTQGDLASLPFVDEAFDAVICIHVLEHVADDHGAIAELHRVTGSAGWVLVNVPMSDQPVTLEDATVRSPRQRRETFGEETHVRVYGDDLVDRLRHPGFQVEPLARGGYSASDVERFGLPMDEKSFICMKRAQESD